MAHPVQGLPRKARLLTRKDFRRVYGQGRRVRGSYLIVVARRRSSPGLRLGLSVSRANGHAVRRNKIKRILREAFRLEQQDLPGSMDLVLIPRPQPRYPLAEVRRELSSLMRRLTVPPRPRKRR